MADVLVEQAAVTDEEDQTRRSRFPVGASLTFEDFAEAGREVAIDALRDAEPVSWVPAVDGWVVSSRAAAREALKRGLLTVESSANLVRASLGEMMLTVDGEEHDRMRKPIEWPFKPAAIYDAYAQPMLQMSDQLIDAFVADGEVKLDAAFAAPYAVRMAGMALGLSLDDVSKIDGIYGAFAEGMVYDGDAQRQVRADAAREELNAILHRELQHNRQTPNSSLSSVLARDPQGLSDDEIVAQLRVVMFGAIETIQASVLTTLYFLLHHPDQMAAVLDDLELLGNAQEESRRLVPPVAFCERWTREPVEIGGVDIPADQFVMISFIGANRDPETFTEPAVFDIHRSNANLSLSFSFGIHACLGMHMARLQTTVALKQLLTRLPNMELVRSNPPDGFAFRRPTDVVLRWSA